MMRFLDYFKRFTYTPNEFYDYLKLMEDAASGDVNIVILPAMTGEGGDGPALEPTVAQANDSYVATVMIKAVKESTGEILEFFNGPREVKVVTDTTAGTVAINDDDQGETGADATDSLTFVNGVCEFAVTLAGTWAENDTVKITVDDDNVGIMGYSIEKNNHFLIDVDANPE